jgi:hypothetical protein
MPDETISAADWVLEVVEEIGGRLAWLTSRREELERLAEMCGLTLSGSTSLEDRLIASLRAGKLLDATQDYFEMCSSHRATGRLAPISWVDVAREVQFPSDPMEIDDLCHANENILFSQSLGTQNYAMWYAEVWSKIIDQATNAEHRAALHSAVGQKLTSKLARFNAAKAYFDAGLYAKAIEEAYPLLQFYSFSEQAEELVQAADKALDKAGVTLVV